MALPGPKLGRVVARPDAGPARCGAGQAGIRKFVKSYFWVRTKPSTACFQAASGEPVLKKNAFSKGQPDWGEELADELDTMIEKHRSENIAAVIVEPVAGSTGVLIPPKNYLNKIKRKCVENNILLIFDEVITGFGRLGKSFASEYFDITPDLICLAKGINLSLIHI